MANLRIPGPTPIPPAVQKALGRQMINHRGPEFATLIERVTEGLRPFFQTKSDLLILTCSGTGAMEAAVVNTLSPGDSVLAVSIGSFGDRFAQIAEAYGACVTRLDVEWGRAVDIDTLRQALCTGSHRAVLVTHNETSTGVTNPLEAIAETVHAESDALILVDAVSSMGCVPVGTDAWGLDVVVTGSQKGWEAPPGLAMAAVGPRAWQAWEAAAMPRFYLDFGKARDLYARGQTPYTPALPILYALEVSLNRMHEEGPEAIFARHARIAARTRRGAQALGLELFADESCASNTITALSVPEGVDGKALTTRLREDYDTVLAGGQGKLAAQIIRLGHLGWVQDAEIDSALQALSHALSDLGFPVPAAASAKS